MSSISVPICLIVPPSIFLLDERVFMSLGILKVAAVLEEAGHVIEMVDLSGVENFQEAIASHVQTSSAMIYGITATTPQMPAAAKIVAVIKEINPKARVVLGGPHATLVHTAYKRELSNGQINRGTRAFKQLEEMLDVIVLGDGEEAIFSAIASNSPKVINANDRTSSMFLTNQKYSSLPFPARHLIDVNSYHYEIEGHKALSIIAQLGCPFECGFCGGRQAPSLRVIRTRSTENIIHEMRLLHETYGITGFMFYDDELNVNPKMVELMEEIIKLQKELKTEFRLRGFVKAELFTERQAEVMVRAGFRWVLTGFESGSTRILKNMSKKATLEENTQCIEIARHHGLKVKALMSIGHPGESKETIMETHKWLLNVKPDDFDVTIITTYPGTPYYDLAVKAPDKDSNNKPNKNENRWIYTYKKTGDRLYSLEVDYNKVANYYKGDPDGGYQSYVYTDYLTREEIIKSRDFLERDVRHQLGIKFNLPAPSIRYEHSMGQFNGGQFNNSLPQNILRTSKFPQKASLISL